MNKQIRPMVFAGIVTSLLVIGCGQRELPRPEVYPTRGHLVYNGEPVRFARIELEPTGGKGSSATAKTDADGNFQVRTFSNDDPDGAVPGEYKVVVKPGEGVPVGYDAKKADPKFTEVPPEARQPAQTVTIEAQDNELEITLQ